jgi:sn-glycerol 3-phosphate transport system permease protein
MSRDATADVTPDDRSGALAGRRANRAAAIRLLDRVLANPYVLIAPVMILTATFTIWPLIFIAYNSMFRWDIVMGTKDFVGLRYFVSIFQDVEFQRTVVNTVIFTVSTVGATMSLALVIAVFLNRNTFVHNAVQAIIFSPHVLSLVSIAVLWMWLMDPVAGVLNQLFGLLGIPPSTWMRGENTSLLSIIIVSVWKSLGYQVMIILAGLQTIPNDVYEAARLDRSSRTRTLFEITIPLLSPTLYFLFVVAIIDSFVAFDVVNLMTKGGPNGSSNLLVHWIYEQGRIRYIIGKGMAGSVVLILAVGVVTLISQTVIRRRVHYQ